MIDQSPRWESIDAIHLALAFKPVHILYLYSIQVLHLHNNSNEYSTSKKRKKKKCLPPTVRL